MGKITLSTLLALGLFGCVSTQRIFDECQTWARQDPGWPSDARVVGGQPEALRASVCERAHNVYRPRPGFRSPDEDYRGRIQFAYSGNALAMSVWLVNARDAPFVGMFVIHGAAPFNFPADTLWGYGDFRATFEGNAYSGSLEMRDGSKCEIRGTTDAMRARLTGSFVCPPPYDGTLELVKCLTWPC